MGIEPDQLPRLFDRFYRTERARASNIKGTGLGLAIVESIITRHYGEIKVESTPGKGSVFTVCFPSNEKFKQRLTEFAKEPA
jgi:signal transduction histidine kinase